MAVLYVMSVFFWLLLSHLLLYSSWHRLSRRWRYVQFHVFGTAIGVCNTWR